MRFGLREMIFMVVLVAMPISSYFFVFKPQNDEINRAKGEIAHKEAMLDKLERATAKTRDLEAANEEIVQAISMIEARLPEDKEIDVILAQVATLARQSRLELPSIRVGKPIPAQQYIEQPIEMKMVGNFDDFYGFTLELERLERITRVPDIVLKRAQRSDEGTVSADFTLSIYFRSGGKESKG
jgi:type IV pilus assembly protein PilO